MTTAKTYVQLDFDTIKSELINHIKTNPQFSDYVFEGGALNAIVDILAYNTHANAYYANMAHNESFLDTAQTRGSVVSRAREHGYTPRSITGASAYLDVSALGATNATITRGTTFTGTNEFGSWSFLAMDDKSGVRTANGVTWTNLLVKHGSRVQNTFVVGGPGDARKIYTIPNINVDTSTLKVWVRETPAAQTRSEFFKVTSAYDNLAATRAYWLQESHDGRFEIYFGNDVLGIQPPAGSLIEIDYFVVDAAESANACNSFVYSGSFGPGTSNTVIVTQPSTGGALNESIDNIRSNAVRSSAARARAVDVNDYAVLLRQKFDFIRSASIWGGEDAVPPQYGRVFISLLPTDGGTITDAVKRNVIMPVIRSYGILTVQPVFVDPEYTTLNLSTQIKYNPNRSTLSFDAIRLAVENRVDEYIAGISDYNRDYIGSELVGSIHDLDSGIMSVSTITRLGFMLNPALGQMTGHSKELNNPIAPLSVTSTKFQILTDVVHTVSIHETDADPVIVAQADGSFVESRTLGLFDASDLLISTCGTVNLTTGRIDLQFSLNGYLTDTRAIHISCLGANSDISVRRNQVLIKNPYPADSAINLADPDVVDVIYYAK